MRTAPAENLKSLQFIRINVSYRGGERNSAKLKAKIIFRRKKMGAYHWGRTVLQSFPVRFMRGE
jgi:hypothetical protein